MSRDRAAGRGLALCMVERVGEEARAVLAGWLGLVTVHSQRGCAGER